MIIKYLKWHYKSACILFEAFINSTEKEIFCIFQNIRFAILRNPLRFSYIKDLDCYEVCSKHFQSSKLSESQIYFLIKERSYLYYDGIEHRLNSLASAYFLDQIKFKPDDLIVDCGANIGEIGVYFFNQNIRYMAFEPSRREFEVLTKNSHSSDLFQAGLWNTSGKKEIWISSKGADSSLIEPAAYTSRDSIRTYRLDQLIDSPVRLLKLEAEGGEPEVIEGCEKLLSKIDYISADLGPERGPLKQNTVCQVTNYLLKREFELFKVNLSRGVFLFRRKGLSD